VREIAAGWVLDLLNYALRTKAAAKTPAWAFTFLKCQFFGILKVYYFY
jgi:hypothetical protein